MSASEPEVHLGWRCSRSPFLRLSCKADWSLRQSLESQQSRSIPIHALPRWSSSPSGPPCFQLLSPIFLRSSPRDVHASGGREARWTTWIRVSDWRRFTIPRRGGTTNRSFHLFDRNTLIARFPDRDLVSEARSPKSSFFAPMASGTGSC